MEEVFKALVYGFVQGVAEFLPISSSAHLIIASEWFDHQVMPLFLNVGLHGGTLLAVLIYFRSDFFQILKNFFTFKAPVGAQTAGGIRGFIARNHLLFMLFIGSIPAGVVGLLWKDEIEHSFHRGSTIIFPLIIGGWLLWLADRRAPQSKDISKVDAFAAFAIGLGQACALIPGVSRSGASIMVARMQSFNRRDAARFSFLLGTPAMLGALALEAKEIMASLSEPIFYVGFLTAAVVGILTIHFFLKLIQRIGFFWFAVYRTGVAGILWFLT